jgi:hypothetical protein
LGSRTMVNQNSLLEINHPGEFCQVYRLVNIANVP